MAQTDEVDGRRYKISEVSEMVDVPVYLLRQWEKRFARLKPKRDHVGRRYYDLRDIDIVRRIKYLLRHEGMTTDGVEKCLDREFHVAGRPRSMKDAMDLINKIESEAYAMLKKLGASSAPRRTRS